MRIPALALALAAGCGGASPASPPPAPPPAALALDAPLDPRASEIVFDGVARDEAWLAAKDVVAPLRGRGPAEVRIRAVHDGKRLYLLVRWKDEDRTRNRIWRLRADGTWERRAGEDGFALAWSPGALADAFRRDGCAILCHEGTHQRPGESGFADVWYWGAQRSDPLRQAIDMALRFGDGDRLRGDGQPADSGNQDNRSDEYEGPRWVPWRVGPDASRVLEFSNAQPLRTDRLHSSAAEREGWEVPRDLVRRALGSRGDVAAAALHHGGEWTLELSREFRTGHGDDQPFGDPQVPAWFAAAVYDGAEGGDHAVSPPIELRFLSGG